MEESNLDEAVTASRPPSGGERRTPWYVADDIAQAVAIAGDHGDLLVVDLENTLVGYGVTAQECHAAMEAAAVAVAADGRIRRLAFVSNARFRLPVLQHDVLTVRVVTGARKPHVRWPPLRRIRTDLHGAAVYGDQPLTDGMLAHHLGGIWIQPRHAHEPTASEPWWPQLMRALGQRAIDRHFRRMR